MQLQTCEFDISGMQGFESIIRDKMVAHFIDNNLISDHKRGFRSNRSCITQLLLIMEHWSKLIDQ